MWHVVVMPEASKRLGEILQNNRFAICLVENRLYGELENNAERYRSHRDPDDPDVLFDYVLYFCDAGEAWLTLRFSVNDARAADYLFVEALSCEVGKINLY